MALRATSYPPEGNIVRPTTVIEAPRLSTRLGTDVVICSETFQRSGSFKFRAAFNVATNVDHPMVVSASSGNFGQAMAFACSLTKKSCTLVMPITSAKVKVDAVFEYGGQVEFVDVRVKTREARVQELAKLHPEAYIASAYDDPFVIEGNSSLGMEIAKLRYAFDDVVVPIGGGGLSSGVIVGLRNLAKSVSVVGAEPLLGNDAARSLTAGELLRCGSEPMTIADGARTLSLGRRNWEILRTGLRTIVEVPEEKIVEATRVLFHLANLKVEPTGALGVAAILTQPALFRDRRVCCVVTGGNVDPALYSQILAG